MMIPAPAVVLVLGCCAFVLSAAIPAHGVDFALDIQPILEAACINCHNEDLSEGELRLDTRDHLLAGGASGAVIEPGKPDESLLYTMTVLPADDDRVMPPADAPPLARVQTEKLKAWIAAGAPWPDGVTLKVQERIGFVEHIQPIFEQNCLACHSPTQQDGELDLSTRKTAFETGASSSSIVPFRPADSLVYTSTILERDDDQLMPPVTSGGPMPKELSDRLRLWIAQGAVWPEGVTLRQKPKSDPGSETTDTFAVVQRIHAIIVANSKVANAAQMANYTNEVPQTGASYTMVALEGGPFMMGSPPDEPQRKENEGPQVNVTVSPFWIGKFEVTWDEYEPYMITQVDRRKNGSRRDYDPEKHTLVDAVSQPTPPYTEMSFGMGQKGFPAISMTQHAANKYCQWLSAQTGHFYRLPTEAEWEYACRAGSTTAYSFGDDPAMLGEYAWYYENSNEKYQKVGTKKPNAWGLHDMHGNVMEWTADRYEPNYFQLIRESPLNPLLKPATLYPRSVRGGGWDSDADGLRSAARRGSDPSWKQQDPQLPKSVWYHTNAPWLGFRLVRPLEIPSAEEMYFYWNSATDKF